MIYIKTDNKKDSTINYWDKRALNVEDVRAITHFDTIQRQLENNSIIKFLNKKDIVLDLGCGNGYSTAIFAKYCKMITGVDFSNEMIKRAKKENSHNEKIHYLVSDAIDLQINTKFTKIITERCLINILSWEKQKKAIINIASHLKEGGYYLMMEGIKNGRDALNDVRERLALESMPKVIYNLDFEKERTEKFLKKYFVIKKFVTFGIYELITRVIFPLYIYPQKPQYGSKFHKIAYEICKKIPDPIPEISKLGFWVLEKLPE